MVGTAGAAVGVGEVVRVQATCEVSSGLVETEVASPPDGHTDTSFIDGRRGGSGRSRDLAGDVAVRESSPLVGADDAGCADEEPGGADSAEVGCGLGADGSCGESGADISLVSWRPAFGDCWTVWFGALELLN